MHPWDTAFISSRKNILVYTMSAVYIKLSFCQCKSFLSTEWNATYSNFCQIVPCVCPILKIEWQSTHPFSVLLLTGTESPENRKPRMQGDKSNISKFFQIVICWYLLPHKHFISFYFHYHLSNSLWIDQRIYFSKESCATAPMCSCWYYLLEMYRVVIS